MEKGNKSSRSFDLEKGAKHSFDLEKKSSRRFDLSKEDETKDERIVSTSTGDSDSSTRQKAAAKTNAAKKSIPSTETGGKVPESTGGSQKAEDKKKNRTLALVAVAVIALIVGIVFFFKGSDNENKTVPQPVVEQTEQPADDKPNEAVVTTGETESTQEATVETPVEVQPTTSSQTAVTPPAKEPQKKVSQIKPVANVNSTTPKLASTIEEQARQVIRGDFGNGEERKRKLGAAYNEIQSMVNELYRTGNWKK